MRFLRRVVLPTKFVQVHLNFGWSFVRYVYFCYVLYTAFFARQSMAKNQSRYYLFFRAGTVALYTRDIAVLFMFFKRRFRFRLMKSIRDPNRLFTKFSRTMAMLPYTRLGILNTNIYFRGRAWGRKKTWTKLEKVSLALPGRPLSQLQKNFFYSAHYISTKYGVYGLKF